MTDNLTPEQRQKNMRNIKCRDTEIEMVLRRALWDAGYRYRKNVKDLPGKPDIVFPKYKIAIFCDSEFFHGKDWDEQKKRIEKGNNAEYWIKKIERNIERDLEINEQLETQGWLVIRFWGKDIKKDLDGCVSYIGKAILMRIIE